MAKVSVIVPVFNSGRFISRCLDSILSQTLKDYEVICVNDCSTDDTSEILESYAKLDDRLRIINLERNAGLSVARNTGLEVAVAEWIYFIDSDDWLDPEYLEAMLNAALKYNLLEVINSNYILEYDALSTKRKFDERTVFKTGFYPSKGIQSHFLPVVWARMFRRSFLEEHRIRFSGARYAEDVAFSGLADLLNDSLFIFYGPAYHYLQRDGSLITNPDIAFNNVLGFISLYDNLLKRGLDTNGSRLFYTYGPLVLDSPERFAVIKDYVDRIKDFVFNDTSLYCRHDLFLIEAIGSCPDYSTYINKYDKNSIIAFFKSSKGF